MMSMELISKIAEYLSYNAGLLNAEFEYITTLRKNKIFSEQISKFKQCGESRKRSIHAYKFNQGLSNNSDLTVLLVWPWITSIFIKIV